MWYFFAPPVDSFISNNASDTLAPTSRMLNVIIHFSQQQMQLQTFFSQQNYSFILFLSLSEFVNQINQSPSLIRQIRTSSTTVFIINWLTKLLFGLGLCLTKLSANLREVSDIHCKHINTLVATHNPVICV
jgi:hypothetical protein